MCKARTPRPPTTKLPTLLAGLLLLLCGALACSDPERRSARPVRATDTAPSLRVIALTDLRGYLEPCGCTSRPLGGIDKSAATLAKLRAEAVPTVVVAAGDLLFGDLPHGAGAEAAAKQEIWKAETLIEILNGFQLAAATLGQTDHVFGDQTRDRLRAAARFPWLGAGTEDTRLVTVGGLKLGLFGLSTAPGDTQAEDALPARAKQLTQQLKQQGAQVVLGLAHTSPRTARRVAGAVEGLDFLLRTRAEQDAVPPPSRLGDTTLLSAGRHGHGLLVLDLFQRGEGAFVDRSPWTASEKKAQARTEIEDLKARIATWEGDPQTDKGQLQRQRQRLQSMQAALAQDALAGSTEGNAFLARFEALPPEVKGDPGTAALVDRYDRRVNEHNRKALAGLKPKPADPGSPSYVGSQTCESCHKSEFAWWSGHKHGIAYKTLEDQHKQFNLSCVGCHVTGYNQPGGSTVVHNEGLTNVGCESCHGPASFHVEDPDADEIAVQRDAPESVCVVCHNEEHSDQFEYRSYRDKLIVPGHGLPES